jgi:hypothetical protein
MLRGRLRESLNAALKERDEHAVAALRLILAALKDRDIAARGKGNPDGIADDEVLAMLQTMVKQRRESIVFYEQGNRPELKAREEQEIIVIERFLPPQLAEDEVQSAVVGALRDLGAETIKDMGRVMAELRAKYPGQMDFGKASAVVRRELTSN